MPKKEFDPTKEYGNYVNVYDEDEIAQTKEIVQKNAELVIPKEFHQFIDCPITSFHHFTTILVTSDNFEQLGVSEKEIGQRLDMPEHWSVGWIYRRTG